MSCATLKKKTLNLDMAEQLNTLASSIYNAISNQHSGEGLLSGCDDYANYLAIPDAIVHAIQYSAHPFTLSAVQRSKGIALSAPHQNA